MIDLNIKIIMLLKKFTFIKVIFKIKIKIYSFFINILLIIFIFIKKFYYKHIFSNILFLSY